MTCRRAMEDCSTDERLQQETLCRRPWTDDYMYVERPETLTKQNVQLSGLSVCCQVDVVRHVGSLASYNVGICTPEQRPYRRSIQKTSEGEVA